MELDKALVWIRKLVGMAEGWFRKPTGPVLEYLKGLLVCLRVWRNVVRREKAPWSNSSSFRISHSRVAVMSWALSPLQGPALLDRVFITISVLSNVQHTGTFTHVKVQCVVFSVLCARVQWSGLACEDLHPNSDVNVNVYWVLCSSGFEAL